MLQGLQERSHSNANFKKIQFEKWISYEFCKLKNSSVFSFQINALYDIDVYVWYCFSWIYIQSSVMFAMVSRNLFQRIIHSNFPSSIKASLSPPLLYWDSIFLLRIIRCSPAFSVYMSCLKGHRKRTSIMNIIGERTRFHLINFNFM